MGGEKWRCGLAVAVLLALALAGCGVAAASSPPLRFREDGTFVIAQFTDMHYGQGAQNDLRTDKVQEAVLAAEQPDLVALSGDQVSGFAWDGKAAWFEERWRQMLQPTLAAGVPHASILGNHDGEANLSRREIIELDQQLGGNLTLTLPGPRYLFGSGNYFLDVLNATGEEVAARMWFLDSGSLGCEGLRDGWGCVPSGTVDWVVEQASALPRVPSLAFIHIPLPQFRELWNSQPTRGTKGEAVACPLRDTGVYEAFRRLGIQAVYSGHDHSIDFYGTLGGVRLAYGRKTGYGNYGPAAGAKGARIIRLRQGQSAALSTTWIRTEDGQRLDQDSMLVLPEAKRAQSACGANAWLWQRLHDRSVVKLVIVCAAGGLGLVAASAALTALLMRWRQRASCKAPTGSIWEDEERAFLRSPASSGSTTP
ncbi:hypothetical protein ABPG77_002834 [Micractinium sp. CCAP 211/92]